MADLGVVDVTFAPEVRPSITTVVLDGEAVLYDDANGRVHHLNRSGTIAFQLLDGQTTIGVVGDTIATAVGADVDVVTADVAALVRMLGQLGVLLGVDPAAIEPPSP